MATDKRGRAGTGVPRRIANRRVVVRLHSGPHGHPHAAAQGDSLRMELHNRGRQKHKGALTLRPHPGSRPGSAQNRKGGEHHQQPAPKNHQLRIHQRPKTRSRPHPRRTPPTKPRNTTRPQTTHRQKPTSQNLAPTTPTNPPIHPTSTPTNQRHKPPIRSRRMQRRTTQSSPHRRPTRTKTRHNSHPPRTQQKTKHNPTRIRTHTPTSPQTPHPQPQRRHTMPILRTTHVPRQTQKLGRPHTRSRPRTQTKRRNQQTPQPPHPPPTQNLQRPRRRQSPMGTTTHPTNPTQTKTQTQPLPMEAITTTNKTR